MAPRIFLKRLVDVLDKVDEHESFDPVLHADIVIAPNEMSEEERAAAGVVRSVDDIMLDVGGGADGGEAGGSLE